MGRLRDRFDRRFVHRDKEPVAAQDREALIVFATSLLGRDATGGSSFDDRVRSAVSIATAASEPAGLQALAQAVADHDVTITLEELTAFSRFARVVGLHEDQWAFVSASVQR